jgi:hypothetical protein
LVSYIFWSTRSYTIYAASSFCVHKIPWGTIWWLLTAIKQDLDLYNIKISRTCSWIFRFEASITAYSLSPFSIYLFNFIFRVICEACLCETRSSSRFFVKISLWMTLEVVVGTLKKKKKTKTKIERFLIMHWLNKVDINKNPVRILFWKMSMMSTLVWYCYANILTRQHTSQSRGNTCIDPLSQIQSNFMNGIQFCDFN